MLGRRQLQPSTCLEHNTREAQAQGTILGKEFNCTPPTTPTDNQRPKVCTLMVFMQVQIARNRKTITILLHVTSSKNGLRVAMTQRATRWIRRKYISDLGQAPSISLTLRLYQADPASPGLPKTRQTRSVYCLLELSATAGVRPSHAINLLFNSNPETLYPTQRRTIVITA